MRLSSRTCSRWWPTRGRCSSSWRRTASRGGGGALAIVLDDTGTQADICRAAATTDSHFLDHFRQAQRLERLFAAAGTQFRSHTITSRAIASSYDDLLTVVAFFLDAAIDE